MLVVGSESLNINLRLYDVNYALPDENDSVYLFNFKNNSDGGVLTVYKVITSLNAKQGYFFRADWNERTGEYDFYWLGIKDNTHYPIDTATHWCYVHELDDPFSFKDVAEYAFAP